jgi:undecaprenyl diphosphate synthase
MPAAIFTDKDLARIDKINVPHHVALIPDGNRRWAQDHLCDVDAGYAHGAETLVNIVRAAKELGIKILTVFTFSTENWLRPQLEIDTVMHVIERYLKAYQHKLLALNVRLHVIGNAGALPQTVRRVVDETAAITRHCSDFDLVLALNYGGRDEICRAIHRIVNDCISNKVTLEELSETRIAQYLDTAKWPDPDLLIRTSGEKRISNFLLWQSSYTEIYIEEAEWHSFTQDHLLSAIVDYQQRERRRGGSS